MTQQEAGAENDVGSLRADMSKLSQRAAPPRARRPLIVAASLLPTARALGYGAVAYEPLPDAKALHRQRVALECAMRAGGRR